MAFSFFKKKEKKEERQDNRYVKLRVKEVRRETADAVSLVFEEPEEKLGYEPGQFITLIMTVNGQKIRRAYSLCSSPFLNEPPTVMVKKVDGGLISVYINTQLKPGDEIEVMKAMGHFVTTYHEAQKRNVILFGGGSGITPLISIAKSVLFKERQSQVLLVYCNRNEDSVIFKEMLNSLQAGHRDRFRVVHIIEQPAADWPGYSGLLDREKVAQIINELPLSGSGTTDYFTCGPAPMMDVVVDGLEAMGIPADKVLKESFVAGETAPAETSEGQPDRMASYKVKILLEGDEHEFEVPAGKTILETGLSLRIDMPYSCQSGLCTACRGKLLAGDVRMDEEGGLTESEKKEGYVLCCVGHPTSEGVVIEIG